MSDLNKCDVASIKYIQKLGSRDMELVVPRNQEIVNINGRYILRDKKPQYPKTYQECCELLSLGEDGRLYTKGYKSSLIQDFQKLLICRDAYWKIAGEQMGLDKPWEPDWEDDNDKYFICYLKDELWLSNIRECNRFLVFPTKEMRDEFYKNFKDLIESCKELL